MVLKPEVDLLNYPETMGISESRIHTLKIIFWLVVLAFGLSAIAWYATAEPDAIDGSFVVVETPSPDPNATVNYHPPLDYIPRIEQGDPVYLNDTIDISGVSGWPTDNGEYQIAYYGKWVTAFSPGDLIPDDIITLPGKYHSSVGESQYRFYIDPEVFGDKPGYWYQFDPAMLRKSDEDAGNLRAFKVIAKYRPVFNSTSNETEYTAESGNYTEQVIQVP